MYISRLTLSHFKSFKGPVTVDFSPYTNVIVGSNGCGKSTIVSALDFLLLNKRLSFEDKKSLIHESNNINFVYSYVEATLENSDMILPLEKTFTLRRCINLKKDEYYLNGKQVTHAEISNILGIVFNSQFIVEQGKVFRLASMSDKERLDVVKEVSGSKIYEKEREDSLKMLKETEHTEEKIQNHLKLLEAKKEKIKKDQENFKKRKELLEEKGTIEKIIDEKELEKINAELKFLEIENKGTEDKENIKENLEKNDILKEIEDLSFTELNDLLEEKVAARDKIQSELNKIKTNVIIDENEKDLSSNCKKLGEELNEIKFSIINMDKIENETKIKLQSINHEIEYLKSLILKDEVPHEEIESTKKVLEENLELLRNRVEEKNNKSLDECIDERNKLWREEKIVKENIGLLKLKIKKHELKINKGFTIPDIKGIHGFFYNLVDIPSELLKAVEIAIGHNLFNLVVEDESVVKKIISKGIPRLTFIPLSRIENREEKLIKDENLIPLQSLIKTEPAYKKIVKFLSKKIYIASDLKTASVLSKRYDIDVVTVSGDVVKRDGSLSGGYRKTILKDYEEIKSKIISEEKRLGDIKIKLAEIENTIKILKYSGEDKSSYFQNIEAISIFLKKKIALLEKIKTKKINSKDVSNFIREATNKEKNETQKLLNIQEEKQIRSMELEEKKNIYVKQERKLKMLKEMKNTQELEKEREKLNLEISNLQERLEQNPTHKIKEKDLETERRKERINFLIRKKTEILERTDEIKVDCKIKEKLKSIDIIKRLVEIKDLLKKTPVSVVPPLETNEIKEKLENLIEGKKEIYQLIKELDERKMQLFNQTLENLNKEFKTNTEKLDLQGFSLILNQDELKISSTHKLNSYSGGQKTMLTLSILLGLLSLNSIPMFVFDEIDANLDKNGREKLANLLQEKPIQKIIVTFKEEMVERANKVFLVKHEEKVSEIEETTKEIANGFLKGEEKE